MRDGLPDLQETWNRLGLAPDKHLVAPDGTISRTQVSPDGERASVLPELAEQHVGELVGEGGMGRVYVTRQAQLGRRIAVKRPRPDVKMAAKELIREARITGVLEHPNIVPIHQLSIDSTGAPSVAMKYLSGETWAARLARTPLGLEHREGDLEVLEQVTRAIAFAHDRGIIHRDIKPQNVMLGSFGEVVVVDWGLALALGDPPVEGVRRASEVKELAGTLAYMAPEMALGRGDLLGPATDVYLLGATLYELLAGRPPHANVVEGEKLDMRQLLSRIFLEPPAPLPDSVPSALREICSRALAASPADRFADAGQLGEALARWQRHRESARLVDEAEKLLNQAERHQPLTAPEVGTWLAQARFGLLIAKRGGGWPMTAQLEERAIVTSARRELLARRPDAAAALLAELPDDAAVALHGEVLELRNELEHRRARQEALERAAAESDLGQAARLRRWFGVGFALMFLGAHLWLGMRLRGGDLQHAGYLATTAVVGLTFALPAAALYRRVFPNEANRRLALAVGLLLSGQVATFVAMWLLGVSFAHTLSIGLFQLTFSVAIASVLLERRVLWTSPLTMGLAVLSALFPDFVVECVGLPYFVYFLAGATLEWDRPDEAVPLISEPTRRPPHD